MDISDLTGIGRLGSRQTDGFYQLTLSSAYLTAFQQIEECFLIFSSDRVFFVTIEAKKSFGKKSYVRFREDGIDEEYTHSAKVTIALAPEDLEACQTEEDSPPPAGFTALFLGKELGIVTDLRQSPLQATLIISLAEGSEVMIPFVDAYVAGVDNELRTVELINISELLEICTSTS